jgi:hypothetical protein
VDLSVELPSEVIIERWVAGVVAEVSCWMLLFLVILALLCTYCRKGVF